jgi:hypothetical protein
MTPWQHHRNGFSWPVLDRECGGATQGMKESWPCAPNSSVCIVEVDLLQATVPAVRHIYGWREMLSEPDAAVQTELSPRKNPPRNAEPC